MENNKRKEEYETICVQTLYQLITNDGSSLSWLYKLFWELCLILEMSCPC